MASVPPVTPVGICSAGPPKVRLVSLNPSRAGRGRPEATLGREGLREEAGQSRR